MGRKNTLATLATTVLLAVLGSALFASAQRLSVGRSWPIAEADAMLELQTRAQAVDWTALMQRANPEDYRPPHLDRLPRAGADRTLSVDLTYTLGMDIPDGKGGVLYPKGYSFNPLDYVPYQQTLVVLDGDDPDQVAWLLTSGYLHETTGKILLTGGSYLDLAKKIKKPVFYADRRIVERFHLQAVPSVIARCGRLMEVREIKIETREGRR